METWIKFDNKNYVVDVPDLPEKEKEDYIFEKLKENNDLKCIDRNICKLSEENYNEYTLNLNDKGKFLKKILDGEYSGYFSGDTNSKNLDECVDIDVLTQAIRDHNLFLVIDILDCFPNLLNEKNNDEYPIHIAIGNNNLEIVKEILKRCPKNYRGYFDKVPLHYACNKLEITKELLNPIYNMKEALRLFDVQNTPLFYAINSSLHTNNFKIVKELLAPTLEALGSPYITKKYNKSPLFTACSFSPYDRPELIMKFLDLELGIEETTNIPNIYGETPFHVACYHGKINVIGKFLKRGIENDVYTPNKKGRTPLHTACRQGNMNMIEKLLCYESGLKSINLPDKSGMTPLQLACKNGDNEIVEYFLDKMTENPRPVYRLHRKIYKAIKISLDNCNNHIERILKEFIKK